MNISDKKIDGGKPFDWGRASADYARYRDIYPQEFYDKIQKRSLYLRTERSGSRYGYRSFAEKYVSLRRKMGRHGYF